MYEVHSYCAYVVGQRQSTYVHNWTALVYTGIYVHIRASFGASKVVREHTTTLGVLVIRQWLHCAPRAVPRQRYGRKESEGEREY